MTDALFLRFFYALIKSLLSNSSDLNLAYGFHSGYLKTEIRPSISPLEVRWFLFLTHVSEIRTRIFLILFLLISLNEKQGKNCTYYFNEKISLMFWWLFYIKNVISLSLLGLKSAVGMLEILIILFKWSTISFI